MIEQIRLQNFKCFEDYTLHLRHLTLLAGLNGMGKSSVLQALLVLRQSHQQGLLPKIGLALNGDLTKLGSAQSVLFEDAVADEIGLELTLSNGLRAQFSFSYNREADVLRLISEPVAPEVFESSLFTDAFHYLQAERVGPRVSYPMSDYVVRQHRQLGTSGEYAEHYLSVFRDQEISHVALAHPASASQALLPQVQAWLGEISPGVELDPQAHPEMDVVSLQYSFVTGKQRSNQYRATNVGFGLTYTLPILVAVLAASPGTLLLLENPEAHLHPQGQARIGELLARAVSAGIQIIVETHSDHVLNGLRVAVYRGLLPPESIGLHYFARTVVDERVLSQVATPQMDRNGRIDEWPDGFFDEWNKNLQILVKRPS